MADRCFEPGPAFFAVLVGGGCLDLLPDSWNAPRHIFPFN